MWRQTTNYNKYYIIRYLSPDVNILNFRRKKQEEPASTYAAFNNERRAVPASGTCAGTAQPAQVHLSVSGSTGAVPTDHSNADVTPSSGSVF